MTSLPIPASDRRSSPVLEMASAPACERSSDPDRPLKDHPVRLWFDNPAYCISPTVSPAKSSGSEKDPPFPADDVRRVLFWSISDAREVLTSSSSSSASSATREGSSCATSLPRQTVAQPPSCKTRSSSSRLQDGAAPHHRSISDTFTFKEGQSLLSYCLDMAAASGSESSSVPDRPLKGLPIKFWFDNPAYCISPTKISEMKMGPAQPTASPAPPPQRRAPPWTVRLQPPTFRDGRYFAREGSALSDNSDRPTSFSGGTLVPADVIRKEAGPFCRTSSSVHLWWELEESTGPKGRAYAFWPACRLARCRARGIIVCYVAAAPDS